MFKLSFFGMMVVSALSLAHPYHVSVIELHERTGNDTLQVTVRIFTHEWEESLNAGRKEPVDLHDENQTERLDRVLFKYLQSRMNLVMGDTLQPQWIGFENRNDETWCYMECVRTRSCDTLAIHSRILYEHGHEQKTIIHWFRENNRVSKRLSAPEENITLMR